MTPRTGADMVGRPYCDSRYPTGTLKRVEKTTTFINEDQAPRVRCAYARECPSGGISAGRKVMFNGYEIWKADTAKCTQYRTTKLGGAMCGRCMKTCPSNLEGLVIEKPFRWATMHVPTAAGPIVNANAIQVRCVPS